MNLKANWKALTTHWPSCLESKPITRSCGQQTHLLTLPQTDTQTNKMTEEEHDFLEEQRGECFRILSRRCKLSKCLILKATSERRLADIKRTRTAVDFEEIHKRTPQEHHNHAHAENLYLRARHIEHDQVHWHLLRWANGDVPCSGGLE